MISDFAMVSPLVLLGWYARKFYVLWASHRGRQIDADGRCTCRAMQDAEGRLDEQRMQIQAAMAQAARMARVALDGADGELRRVRFGDDIPRGGATSWWGNGFGS